MFFYLVNHENEDEEKIDELLEWIETEQTAANKSIWATRESLRETQQISTMRLLSSFKCVTECRK